MTQPSLDFGPGDRRDRGRMKALRVLGDVVDELSYEVACGVTDARRSELIDALGGREGRYFRLEWAIAIWSIANPDQKARIEAACFPKQRELTDAEKLARLELRVVERLGPVGAQLVEENRR